MAGNKVKIDIVVDAKKGTKDVKKFGKETEKSMKTAAKGMSGLTKAALAGAAAFAAIVAVKMASWVKNQISSWADYADNIAKSAVQIGLTTEALQEMQFIAERNGIAVGDMDKALILLNRNMAEAADGTAAQADAFADLGLNAEALMQMDLPDAFQLILEKTRGMGTEAKRTQILFDIFGRSGAKLKTIMNSTEEGVEALRKRFKELGGGLSGENLIAAERYKDAVLDIGVAWRAFVANIGPEAAKLLGWIADNMGKWIKQTQILLGLGAAAKIDFYRGRIEQLWEAIIELEVQQKKFNRVLNTSGMKVASISLREYGEAVGWTEERIQEVLKQQRTWGLAMEAEVELTGDLLLIQQKRDVLHQQEIENRKELLKYKKLIADLEKKETTLKPTGAPTVGGATAPTTADAAATAALAAMNNAKRISISLIEDERTKAKAAMEEKIEISKQEYEAKVEKHGQFVEFVLEQNTKELEARQEHADSIATIEETEWARRQQILTWESEARQEKFDQEVARDAQLQALTTARDERGFIDLENDLARTGRFYAEKLALAREAGASEMQLEEIKKNFAKDAAMSGLQTTMQIAGQLAAHSKNAWRVYKATAIAQTIISTWKSAQSSYEALAPIPVVGPALGIAAAAAAVIQGMIRVQSIRKQERPSAAEGGVFTGPKSGFPATLHGTEAVIPLPNGRSIPVEGTAGGGTLIMTINAVDSQSVVDLMSRNPQAIIGPMVEQMQLGNRNLISTMQNTTREE